jgi:hypothetical protein
MSDVRRAKNTFRTLRLQTFINGKPKNRNNEGVTVWTAEDLQFHSWQEQEIILVFIDLILDPTQSLT